jgi:hypothetical protein
MLVVKASRAGGGGRVARPLHATARVIAQAEASCHSIEVGAVSIGPLSTDTAYATPCAKGAMGAVTFANTGPLRLNSIYRHRYAINRRKCWFSWT